MEPWLIQWKRSRTDAPLGGVITPDTIVRSLLHATVNHSTKNPACVTAADSRPAHVQSARRLAPRTRSRHSGQIPCVGLSTRDSPIIGRRIDRIFMILWRIGRNHGPSLMPLHHAH